MWYAALGQYDVSAISCQESESGLSLKAGAAVGAARRVEPRVLVVFFA